MSCPVLALWLFVPGLAGVGVCHLVSKKVGMLEIETTNLYHLRLYGLHLEVNLPFLPPSQD